eukprot:gene7423-31727_t
MVIMGRPEKHIKDYADFCFQQQVAELNTRRDALKGMALNEGCDFTDCDLDDVVDVCQTVHGFIWPIGCRGKVVNGTLWLRRLLESTREQHAHLVSWDDFLTKLAN